MKQLLVGFFSHRAWFRSNSFQATLSLFFATIIAFTIFQLSWAQTTGTTSTLTALSTQTAAIFHLDPTSASSGAPPLVMLLLSRDEQLSIKAYTDYTDLDGDGLIDTTYKDSFSYGGYFDNGLCYANSTKALFTTAAAGTGTYGHQCSNQWSGNFLNWLTMTRLDIIRQVLFGGKRSTDSSTQTILQRAYLPDDVHSFQKVYPNTLNDIGNFVPSTYAPGNSTPVSFCNTSNVGSSSAYSTTGYHPLLRIARGSFPEWAATEQRQCDWRDTGLAQAPSSDQPYSAAGGGTGSDELQVFVDVCDNPSYREKFCRAYTNGSVTTYKPAGLLQQYGESGQLRFGLVTGTYDHSRSGGVVRRNIGKIANNDTTSATGCATGDEINFQTGIFCNQVAGAEGIINTIQRLQISQWPNFPGNTNGSLQGYNNTDCNYGVANRGSGGGLNKSPSTDSNSSNRACSDWHNPLAEMYAEALRYIEGNGNQPTPGFVPGSGSVDASLGLPNSVAWTDPYTPTTYCASCSIIVLSTGFGSFDTDEIPNVPNLGDATAAAATTRLGTIENSLSGNIIGNDIIGYYGATPTQTGTGDITLNGSSGTTSTATCAAQNVGDLALVRGVCPEQPNTEGGYHIAGLAFDAWTNDLRPGTTYPGTQSVKTYAVSLAETLPSLTIPTTQGNIVLSPLCKNYGGNALPAVTSASSKPGGTTCTIDDVSAQPLTSTALYPSGTPASNGDYTAPTSGGKPVTFGLPTTATSSGSTGSLVFVWEDSPWGGDHDRDIISMVTYCTGPSCKGSGICSDQLFTTQVGTTMQTSAGSPRNACSGITGVGADGSGVSSGQALVRTEMISASTGNSMLAGYTVNGTGSTDGAYAVISHTASGADVSSVLTGFGMPYTNSGKLGLGNAPIVNLFTANATTNNSLQNPLFYAAKYGGFAQTGRNSDGTPFDPTKPATTAQWDQSNNNTGSAGADGLPDNYFPVRNPAQLSAQLSKVFASILGGTGSGTAAAVVASQRNGDGATYQAFYDPSVTDASNRTATWLGAVQSLFTDQEGNLRENNTAHSGSLIEGDFTASTGNPAVLLCYVVPANSTTGSTLVYRYTTDPAGTTCGPNNTPPLNSPAGLPLSAIKSIWNARDQLASLSNSQATTQRSSYAATADTGRYILTAIDSNLDGNVGSSEMVPFALSSFQSSTGNTFGLLNVGDSTSAQTLINYIRGQDVSGLRNRTVDYYGAGASSPPTYRLGDVVNSTPTVVSSPQEAYDLLYNDQTYTSFRQQYQLRRNVVYVGANDGMIHAFNGGFYDANKNAFQTTPIDPTVTASAHPLGSELWAYVPFNLLPHLIWLTSPNYAHVYYADGSPRVFDARVFKVDADHPSGWGTVLVVGFRFGGGMIDLPASQCANSAAFSGFSLASGAGKTCGSVTVPKQDVYTHSGYVVLDITNPEKAPVLIAELGVDPTNSIPSLNYGFTTSYPTAVPFSARGGSTGTADNWYLAFGNGPTDLGSASLSSEAQLFLYQLAGSTSGTSSTTVTPQTPLNLAANSFTGDPVSVDWDLDFKPDALYVGTASGTPYVAAASGTQPALPGPAGQLIKIDTTASGAATDPTKWIISTLVNPAMPILAAPAVALDNNGQHWVYAGTGRLFVGDDKNTKVPQQSLFGVIDGTTAPNYANLVDVTSAAVTQATAGANPTISGVSGATTETNLESLVKNGLGWKIKLGLNTSVTSSAERVLSTAAVAGGQLFATAYTPDTSLCIGAGASRLFGVNYITGVVNPTVPAFSTTSGGITTYSSSISLGAGLAAAPTLHTDTTTGANGQVSVVTQTSTGAILVNNAAVAPTTKNGEIDWRETLPNSN